MTTPSPPDDFSYISRFAQGVFWSLIGTAGARVFTFIGVVIAARLLGQVGFGQLGMIQSTIGLLGVLAGFGLGLTTSKYVAELKDTDSSRAGRIIALGNLGGLVSGSLMTLTCILAGPWLAEKTLNAPHLSPFLQISSLLLVLSTILGVQQGALTGFQAFRSVARINFFQAVLSLPVTIGLVYCLGLLGAVLSLNLSALLGIFLAQRAVQGECAARAIPVNYRGSWAERRILWDFSLPAVLSGSMVSPVTWAANAMLVNQPGGYAELGLFNAAGQFRMIVAFVPAILGWVTVPLLAEMHGQQPPEFFARAVNANLRTIWAFTLPVGFLAIGFSSWLISLYGEEFRRGQAILALMVCVTILNLANNTIGQTLVGSGRMWAGLGLNCGWALVFLTGALFLVPDLGALGLTFAYLLSYSAHTIIILYYTSRRFGHGAVRHTPRLALFTGGCLLLALAVGHTSDYLLMALSVILGAVTTLTGWSLLPTQGRQKLADFLRSC